MLGTWAETAEQCAAKDKTNIVIQPAKYRDGGGDCAVHWIVETAGSDGINYACIAFASAHRSRRRPKPQTSSCDRLAQIARPWDERSKI